MRAFLTIMAIGLVALGAIVVFPYVYGNPGYVMISVGKGYVEMTLLALLLWLLAIWLVMKVVVYVISRLLRLSSQTRFYFFNKSEKKAQAALKQGLSAYLLGDYIRAEKLLSSAGKHSGLTEPKHMFAAAAADANGDEGKVLMHLNALDADDIDTALLKAKLLCNRGQWGMAHDLIEPLQQSKPKDDGLFRLYVDILKGLHNWQALLKLLPQIDKRNSYSAEQFEQLAAEVIRHALADTAERTTFEAAEQQYEQLPNKLKRQAYAVSGYVELLLTSGRSELAQTALLKGMKKHSITPFLPLLRRVGFDNVVELNKYLQSALQKDENNADLLRGLAYIAAGRGDWALAAKGLAKAIGSDADSRDLELLAKAYEQVGDSHSAVTVYQKLHL